MFKPKTAPSASGRNKLAYATLSFSGVAITILAVFAIWKSPENTMTIFNIVLPVLASWVGTILAFYFGRENFESASEQVGELVNRLSPEQRAKTMASTIMRALLNMAYFKIPKGKGDQDILLTELRNKFGGNVTRLPIINSDEKPRYIIHESSVDKYIISGGKPDDTLEQFIATQRKAGLTFGPEKGFVVVSERSPLADAKQKLEDNPSCQDVFVTKGGSADEPLLGWISNVRMAKFLKM